MQQKSLAEVEVSGRVRIDKLCVEDGVRARMIALGFRADQDVEVIRIAPWGGPIQVRIGMTDIILRRVDARAVQVL